jgi:hypothetical protein
VRQAIGISGPGLHYNKISVTPARLDPGPETWPSGLGLISNRTIRGCATSSRLVCGWREAAAALALRHQASNGKFHGRSTPPS